MIDLIYMEVIAAAATDQPEVTRERSTPMRTSCGSLGASLRSAAQVFRSRPDAEQDQGDLRLVVFEDVDEGGQTVEASSAGVLPTPLADP